MKPFKFFKGYVYSDEYTLPDIRRMAGRTHIHEMVNQITPISNLVWTIYNQYVETEQITQTIRSERV